MSVRVTEGHIAAVLGHSTMRMSERYSHLAPANARDAVALLQGVPNPVPSASVEESAAKETS